MYSYLVLPWIYVIAVMVGFTESCSNWTILDPPIVFGQTAKLGCTADRDNLTTVREWSYGPEKIPLVVDGITNNPNKYQEYTQVHPFQSVLHIKNFAKSDVDVNYTCSIGFHEDNHKLELHERYFEYHPKVHQSAKVLIQRCGYLLGEFAIPQVYPIPKCRAIFKGLDISKSLEVTTEQNRKLYSAKITLDYKTDECKGLLDISCLVGKSNIQIYDELLTGCKETKNEDTKHVYIERDEWETNTIYISAALDIVLVLAVIFGIIICLLVFYLQKCLSCRKLCNDLANKENINISGQSDPFEAASMMSKPGY